MREWRDFWYVQDKRRWRKSLASRGASCPNKQLSSYILIIYVPSSSSSPTSSKRRTPRQTYTAVQCLFLSLSEGFGPSLQPAFILSLSPEYAGGMPPISWRKNMGVGLTPPLLYMLDVYKLVFVSNLFIRIERKRKYLFPPSSLLVAAGFFFHPPLKIGQPWFGMSFFILYLYFFPVQVDVFIHIFFFQPFEKISKSRPLTRYLFYPSIFLYCYYKRSCIFSRLYIWTYIYLFTFLFCYFLSVFFFQSIWRKREKCGKKIQNIYKGDEYVIRKLFF